MRIPGVDTRDTVPPPLPPPRHPPCTNTPYLDDDMFRDTRDRTLPPSSFNSGYGSAASSLAESRSRLERSPKRLDERDEGYASWSSNERSIDSFPSRFGLHHSSFQFQSPADVHGDTMKRKLNPLRTSDKPTVSLLGASSDELLSRRPAAEPRYPPELSMPSVKLPYHPRALDSAAQLSEKTPSHSAVSPRHAPFGRLPGDHRVPRDGPDMDRSPRARTRRNNSEDASSTQGSYDYAGAEEMDVDDLASPKRPHMDDAYMASGGQKRRAASPPAADGSMYPSDTLRRRETGGRGSPTPRLTNSGLPPLSRSDSYVSTASMAQSTATAYSYEHCSPSGNSSGGVSPISGNSPYTTPKSLNPSPRGSISTRAPLHTRNVSNSTPMRLPEMQKPGGSKMQAFFMCECCPKKPKKFETHEELRAHESEKQYNCSFCGNRFKNKNEAERHQNSLHVRRHSWSCSALSGYDRAFHGATNRPGEADTCGYCGVDFPRSGVAPNGTRIANDQDWDERIRHLQDTHKFRECNSSKKFFRADHFRQHLKHSHAGSSGKWTNMLENACMIEEEPPTPR